MSIDTTSITKAAADRPRTVELLNTAKACDAVSVFMVGNAGCDTEAAVPVVKGDGNRLPVRSVRQGLLTDMLAMTGPRNLQTTVGGTMMMSEVYWFDCSQRDARLTAWCSCMDQRSVGLDMLAMSGHFNEWVL